MSAAKVGIWIGSSVLAKLVQQETYHEHDEDEEEDGNDDVDDVVERLAVEVDGELHLSSTVLSEFQSVYFRQQRTKGHLQVASIYNIQ